MAPCPQATCRPCGLRRRVRVLLAATAPALDSAAADPAVEGEWSAPFTPPDAVTGVHLTLLHTGKVLMFGEEGETAVWNPVRLNTTKRIAIPGPIFCGGHTILANGRVFVPGGRIVGIRGPKSTEIFNAAKEQVTHGPDMNAGRYYPTATLLANKKVLTRAARTRTPSPTPMSRSIHPARARSPRSAPPTTTTSTRMHSCYPTSGSGSSIASTRTSRTRPHGSARNSPRRPAGPVRRAPSRCRGPLRVIAGDGGRWAADPGYGLGDRRETRLRVAHGVGSRWPRCPRHATT